MLALKMGARSTAGHPSPNARPPAAKHFGLFPASPFNRPAVIEAAMQLGKVDCMQEQDGGLVDKRLLRLAFQDVLTCWRHKDPLEVRQLSNRCSTPSPCQT